MVTQILNILLRKTKGQGRAYFLLSIVILLWFGIPVQLDFFKAFADINILLLFL